MQEKQPNLAENFSEEVLWAKLGPQRKILHPLKAKQDGKGGSGFIGPADLPRQMDLLRPAKANFLLHTRHTSICTEVSLECQGVAYGKRGARETISSFSDCLSECLRLNHCWFSPLSEL